MANGYSVDQKEVPFGFPFPEDGNSFSEYASNEIVGNSENGIGFGAANAFSNFIERLVYDRFIGADAISGGKVTAYELASLATGVDCVVFCLHLSKAGEVSDLGTEGTASGVDSIYLENSGLEC